MTPQTVVTYIRFYQDYDFLMNTLESCETEEQVNSSENVFYNLATKYSPVIEKEMRNLTPLMVKPLYKRKFWDACRADDLVSGLDYCVFDVSVNSGPGRAIKFLQSCVGATPDGGYGSITAALVKKAQQEDPARLIELYCATRLEFLEKLPTFATFGKGWSRRVAASDGYRPYRC